MQVSWGAALTSCAGMGPPRDFQESLLERELPLKVMPTVTPNTPSFTYVTVWFSNFVTLKLHALTQDHRDLP